MYLTWGSYLGRSTEQTSSPIGGVLAISIRLYFRERSRLEINIKTFPVPKLTSINQTFLFLNLYSHNLSSYPSSSGMLMPLSRVAAGALAVAVPRQPLLNTVAATAGALRRTTPRAAVKGSFAHHQTQSRTNSTMSSQQIIVNTDKAPAGGFWSLMTPSFK